MVDHAIQDATADAPMRLRTGLVPVAGIGSNLGYVLFLIGFFVSSFQLATLGLVLFSGAAVFAARPAAAPSCGAARRGAPRTEPGRATPRQRGPSGG